MTFLIIKRTFTLAWTHDKLSLMYHWISHFIYNVYVKDLFLPEMLNDVYFLQNRFLLQIVSQQQIFTQQCQTQYLS